MSKKPKLGITMGDPAGIGPEIIVKSLEQSRLHDLATPIVIADPGVMERAIRDIVKSKMKIHPISQPEEALGNPGVMDVLPPAGMNLGNVALGKVDPACGHAAFESVRTAIDLAMAKKIDGTVTAPINKEAVNLAGHHFDGHTEIYAHFTNTSNYTMMLADGNLRVVHVSTHVPMVNVSSLITVDRIMTVLRLGHAACLKFGLKAPRLGVSGYNPHAGENGLFGKEEIDVIAPAVALAQKEGMNVSGPFPPDSVFAKAAGGGFDMVVAMYHDQGHIPLKMLSFKYDGKTGTWSGMTGVNITLGLPIVRASVDHGTAFENAGKNVASPQSMINAIEYGAMLSAKE